MYHYLNKILNSLQFAYIIFEGFAKGSIYLVFLYFNLFTSNNNYIFLVSLFSTEILLTILNPSYYAEGFFTLKWKVKKGELLKNYFRNSLFFYLFFGTITLLLKDLPFFLNLSYQEIILLNTIVLGNILIRIISVYLQSINNHRLTLKLRMIAPLFTSIFLITLYNFNFSIIESYLFSKLIAIILTFIFYIFFIKQIINAELNTDKKNYIKDYSKSLFMYKSLIIGFIGWISGIGFFKIAELLNEDSSVIFNIATSINIIAFYQFTVSGTNQLYYNEISLSKDDNFFIKAKIHLRKLTKFLLFIAIISVVLLITNSILILKNDYTNPILLALIIFTINIFSYSANPTFYVNDKLSKLILIQISSLIILIIGAYYYVIMKNNINFEILYLMMFVSLNIPQFIYLKIKNI